LDIHTDDIFVTMWNENPVYWRAYRRIQRRPDTGHFFSGYECHEWDEDTENAYRLWAWCDQHVTL